MGRKSNTRNRSPGLGTGLRLCTGDPSCFANKLASYLYQHRQATLAIRNTYMPALQRLRQEDCSEIMVRLGGQKKLA